MRQQVITGQQLDRIALLLRNGESMAVIGEALGVSRNAVSGLIHRRRKAGDARFAPAGAGAVITRKQRMDALADAWAEGAADMDDAAHAAGVTITVAQGLWVDIRAQLGWQAG